MIKYFNNLIDFLEYHKKLRNYLNRLKGIRFKNSEFCPHCRYNKIYKNFLFLIINFIDIILNYDKLSFMKISRLVQIIVDTLHSTLYTLKKLHFIINPFSFGVASIFLIIKCYSSGYSVLLNKFLFLIINYRGKL